MNHCPRKQRKTPTDSFEAYVSTVWIHTINPFCSPTTATRLLRTCSEWPHTQNQIRSELSVAGMASVARRLRESTATFGQGIRCTGVEEVDFRRILREATLPLTESDIRRIFAHFEVSSKRSTMALASVLKKSWCDIVIEVVAFPAF